MRMCVWCVCVCVCVCVCILQVNAIFVNIFGGIIRCDEIAKGIIAAAQESNLTTPIVVRLQGNFIHLHIIHHTECSPHPPHNR